MLFNIPYVQSALAKRATTYVNETYKTAISVKEIDLSHFPNVNLKDIVIKDHHDYPFIRAKHLKTSLLNWKKILDNELLLDAVFIDGLYFELKTYKNEEEQNLTIFTDKFEDTIPKEKNHKDFILTTDLIQLDKAIFYFFDENKQEEPIVFYTDIKGNITDFKVDGTDIFAKVNNASFVDNNTIVVTDFNTGFVYTETSMQYTDLSIATEYSFLQTDSMVFKYAKGDLGDFNNKVQIETEITKASIALKDLHLFYKELGKTDIVHFTTNFKGTLNDFYLKNLLLTSDKKMEVNGDFHFINAINRENGFSLKADLSNVTSDYHNLKQLLPNLLGNTISSSFAILGKFKLKGKSYITKEHIESQLEMDSSLGKTITDLKISNIDNIEDAKYKGKVQFVNFDLGKIMKDSLVGKLSFIADIDGRGFSKELLNTKVDGHITKHQYKGYTYSNMDIKGVFKNQHFNGNLQVDDPNIKLSFNGLADLSQEKYSFNFESNVHFANFNELNLFTRDSISILKGKIKIDLLGNTLDNISGEVSFKDASYTNQNDFFVFNNFAINSSFSDDVRTVTINSEEIINGKLTGKFKFAELPNLIQNSLGSIYTHYKPLRVSSNQHLNFNFKVHDKIIGVFFPEITVAKNTFFKGKINSDKAKFELTFKSPKLRIKDNTIEKIRLQVDNQNPLYNTMLSIDAIKMKQYKIKNVNLVNVTLNDTLFIRTDFVGGKGYKENFDLSLYHTINKKNQSVIGFKKSNFDYNERTWEVNPNKDTKNKIIMDSNFSEIDFEKFTLVSEEQKVLFFGKIEDANNKELHFNFTNVALEKVTSKIDSIALGGIINGKIDYIQKEGGDFPKANITINNLEVNKLRQGTLLIKADANNNLKKYNFTTSLIKENSETFSAQGIIDFSPEESIIDAEVKINNLDIKALSPLGGENITKIRGVVSGKTKLTGLLRSPDMDGYLYINNAALAFPYLNTEYKIKGNQKVDLYDQTFDINETTIIDIEKQTEGLLTGTFTHANFLKWFIDLKIKTDNLLVLNTEEDEDTPYYGTGFMNGEGVIFGPTSGLVIDVIARTNPGTKFIVPLSDVNTIDEDKLIRFEKENAIKEEKDNGRPDDVVFDEGLTLLFDLTVTTDAIAQIIIDKSTGSVLRGRGRGKLDIAINTNGRFDMSGKYVVDSGIYELNNIVSKKFDVQKGGTISWNGSPFDAYLDIIAVHKVKANPSILLENINATRDIDVNLITNITGNLYQSKMNFDISLPNASTLVQSELAYKINDEDKKMIQFFSLLGFGTFINPENIDYANSGSSLVYEAISEKITNVVSNIINNEEDLIEVGLKLGLGEINKNNVEQTNLEDDIIFKTNDQFDITFKTNLYKKIIVNGIVGVPVGSRTQSSIVGEIEVELPLNKRENFRAKMYSKHNEVQFDILDTEAYTQGLGLSYQFNWDNASEFLEKLGLKKSKKKKKKTSKSAIEQKKDSVTIIKSEVLSK